MKIISWNVNGLRAVERKKALLPFLEAENPDILCFQEIKMSEEADFSLFRAQYTEYEQFYNPAEKKGYAGTAIWVKKTLFTSEMSFFSGMDGWEDKEGRISGIFFGKKVIITGYFPNGGKSEAAWEEKLRFYDHFLTFVDDLRKKYDVFWGGDVNCAHNAIDLARPRENDGQIGFHPKERAWLDHVLAQKWVDIFRFRFPKAIIYSWWHLISKARARNVGWRIDYWFCDEKSELKVTKIAYLTEVMGSDHCPVLLELTKD